MYMHIGYLVGARYCTYSHIMAQAFGLGSQNLTRGLQFGICWDILPNLGGSERNLERHRIAGPGGRGRLLRSQ